MASTINKIDEPVPTPTSYPVAFNFFGVYAAPKSNRVSRQVYAFSDVTDLLERSSRGTFHSLSVKIIPNPAAVKFVTQVIGVWAGDDVEIKHATDALQHPGHFVKNFGQDSLEPESFSCNFEDLGISVLAKPAPQESHRAQLTIFFCSAAVNGAKFPEKKEDAETLASVVVHSRIEPGGYRAI